MLEIEDLHVAYGDSQIVQGVSLSVREGQVVALLGRNGVGKTTLIRAIAGLTPAWRGRVLLRGRDITRVPAHEIARLGIRLVPQGRRLFPSLEVREHLAVGARAVAAAGRPSACSDSFPGCASACATAAASCPAASRACWPPGAPWWATPTCC
jgi:branched-chain amino acid transport system ATP-binding protein